MEERSGQVPEETEGKNFEDLRRRIPSYGFGFILADEVPDIAARSLRQREGQDRGSVEGWGVQLNMALFQL